MAITTDIAQLPDFPAMRQLARALWREGAIRGAAVFVGAGFSRNAERPARDTPRPPLWPDLVDEMVKRLYPHAPNSAPRDPLRLAEEFRVYFGQAVLDEFIRTRICDDEWKPGQLHRQLLELPWADVLTTNWDTLLERAAKQVSVHDYEPVRNVADLAHARGRRIVKLHGSIGTTEHFIFAEEDYRTYPTVFAAFVNFARQVFVENELCLIGFSGDDPNFLQWSGWVRDHLGGNTRRIYLVGDLDLVPAKRKLLEARNIAPIDLAPLFEKTDTDRDHRQMTAAKLFLDFLGAEKPTSATDWTPAFSYDFAPKTPEDWQRQFKDADYAASLLDKAAKIWKAERESYPGWLVCPTNRRTKLRTAMERVPSPTEKSLEKLAPDRRCHVLYEIAWRHRTAFWPIDAHLAEMMASVADANRPNALTKTRQLEIACLLLRTAREADDEDAFARWASIIEANSEPGSDFIGEVAYQRCLRARDNLDFNGIKKSADAVASSDPVWLLRQASLRCELGDIDDAPKLILMALTELRERQRVNRKSLWVCSRLAWAEWLARAVEHDSLVPHITEKWLPKFEEADCDPFDALAQIKSDADRIKEKQEKERRIVPQFKPGYYRDPSKTIHFQSSTVVSPAATLEMLMETVGLPMRFQHVALAVEPSRNTIGLQFAATTKNYVQLLRVVGDESDPLIVRYLGRIALAGLPADVVATLTTKVLSAVSYWTERAHDNRIHVKGFAIGRLRVFVECLARLVVCSAEARVLAIFDLAMDLARDPSFRHHWLFEVLDHLVEFTVQAAPPAERARVILALLEFPLPSEKGISDVHGRLRWPNPIDRVEGTSFTRPKGDTRWDTCIHRLIEAAGAGNPNREVATARLTYLAGQQLLSHTEWEAFKATLWSETDHFEASLPAGVNLLPNVFAYLPAPDGIDISARVRARIFEQVNSVVDKSLPQGQVEAQLKTIVAAASGYGGCERMLPTRDEALILFNQMTSWRPRPQPKAPDFADAFAAAMGLEEHISQWIGVALERSVVPAFPAEDLTLERAQAVLSLIEEGSVSTAIAALPYFTRVAVALPDILRIVRRAIIGRQSNEVHGGTSAVTNWATLARNGNIDPLPRALIEQVIYAIETRHEFGLADLLKCARSLLEEELLKEEDIARLDDALGNLAIETDYKRIDPESRAAITVSFVRAESVLLAHALDIRGRAGTHGKIWLNIAPTDPLPEVRFALAARG